MTIASTIDRGSVYVAAELGCNMAGRVSVAIQMVDSCSWAGASGVKTQRRDIASMNPEILDAPYSGPHSFGDTYRAHREALELSYADQEGILWYARDKGMSAGCSAWDIKSAREIKAIGFDWLKIPSALATDLELLAEVAAYGMPVVVSWGMCSAEDVRRGTAALEGAEIYGLHSTSCYPLAHEDVNLAVLPALAAEYVATRAWRGLGYSDHTTSVVTGALAVAMGARFLEKHTTLDRAARGSDHAASVEPDGLRRYVRDAQAALRMMGTAEKRVLECERGSIKKLRAAHVWGRP